MSLRNSDGHFCGGSILNDRYILTAAHCVENTSKSSITIWAGVTDFYSPGNYRQILKVKNIYIHPKFRRSTLDYDVAVLEVKKPFRFNNNVQPVTLISSSDKRPERVGNTVQVSGWGVPISGGSYTSNLLYAVDVPVISNQTAQKSVNGTITPRMIATGPVSPVKRKGVCNGDSGGPLVFKQSDKKDIQIGVVSWAIWKCPNNKNSISGYARVSELIPWIYDQMLSLSGGARVCYNSGRTYRVSGHSSVKANRWRTSRNLYITSSGSRYVSVRSTDDGVADEDGWIEARTGSGTSRRIMLKVGKPDSKGAYIPGGSTLKSGSWYRIDIYGGASGWDKVKWIIPSSQIRSSGWGSSTSSGSVITKRSAVSFSPLSSAVGQITVNATFINACGDSQWVRRTFNLAGSSGGQGGVARPGGFIDDTGGF